MGLTRFEIIFNNPHGIYYSGCYISGNIYLDVDSPKKVRGIEVRYKGGAKTRWKHEGGSSTIYKADETYLCEKCYVYGNGEEEFEIPEGKHVFPFNWKLPSDIPGSFEGFYGRIRYSVKVVVERPWKFDHVIQIPFTVIPVLDLNRVVDAVGPMQKPIEKENRKTFWGHGEPLYMSISLPVRGYVPGQNIPIKVKLNNQSGLEVEKLRVVMKKVVTYHASGETRSRKELIVDFEIDVEEGQDLLLTNLKVPSLPPSYLNHCRIIDINYTLKVEARVEGWYNKNLKVRTDVVIGTIPLLTYQVPQHTTQRRIVLGFEDDTESVPSTPITEPTAPDDGLVFPMEMEEYSTSLPKPTFEKCLTYKASKPEKDDAPGDDSDADSDEEIASSFDPMYQVYDFAHLFSTDK